MGFGRIGRVGAWRMEGYGSIRQVIAEFRIDRVGQAA